MTESILTDQDVAEAMEQAQPNRPEGGELAPKQLANEIAEQEQKIAALSSIQKIESGLDQLDDLIVTPGVTPKRVVATLKMAMLKEPKLQQCTVRSLYESVMKAVSWGLDPTGNSNSGWFLPYWNKDIKANECQLMPGYGGLVQMAIRRGLAKTIRPAVVHEGDEFAYDLGTDPHIKHSPAKLRQANAAVTHAYAVAHFEAGVPAQFEVLHRDELDAIKAASKGGKSGFSPWNGPFAAEMCKKSAIRRLCKNLPCDGVMADAVAMAHRDDIWDSRGFDPNQMTGAQAGAPNSASRTLAEGDAEGGDA